MAKKKRSRTAETKIGTYDVPRGMLRPGDVITIRMDGRVKANPNIATLTLRRATRP